MPPSSAPVAPPAPATALHMPIERASFGPENVVTMIVSVAGDRIAPPKPWTARAVVSHVSARREAAGEARAGEDREPEEEDRFWPNRSAARPPSRRNPANVST